MIVGSVRFCAESLCGYGLSAIWMEFKEIAPTGWALPDGSEQERMLRVVLSIPMAHMLVDKLGEFLAGTEAKAAAELRASTSEGT